MMQLRRNNSTPVFDIATGALAGGAATWLMGHATTLMYEGENPAARAREEAVRGEKDAYTRAVDKVARTSGLDVGEEQQKKLGNALHWALGIGAGALYGWLRHRIAPGSQVHMRSSSTMRTCCSAGLIRCISTTWPRH